MSGWASATPRVDAGAASTTQAGPGKRLAGIGIALSERLTLDVGYRYFAGRGTGLRRRRRRRIRPSGGDRRLALPIRRAGAAAPARRRRPRRRRRLPHPAAGRLPDLGIRGLFRVGSLEPQRCRQRRHRPGRGARAPVQRHRWRAIVGHTDTSGSTAYNAGPVASGAPASCATRWWRAAWPPPRMTTQARGETELARANPRRRARAAEPPHRGDHHASANLALLYLILRARFSPGPFFIAACIARRG